VVRAATVVVIIVVIVPAIIVVIIVPAIVIPTIFPSVLPVLSMVRSCLSFHTAELGSCHHKCCCK